MQISTITTQTMSSLEIVKMINDLRDDNVAILSHGDFMAKCRKILGKWDNEKFLYLTNQSIRIEFDGFTKRPKCYYLPKREANLMVMSESYKVQAAVYDRMTELEENQVKPKTALELAKEQVILLEALEVANKTIEQQDKSITEKNNLISASNEASIKAGEIKVSEFVKSIDIVDLGERQFYQWMREQGYLFKGSREPRQEYVKRGYFSWKPSAEEYGGKVRYSLRITPRGKVWLAARYMAYIDNEIAA
jgi:phage antirepressor YoqD-like protein